MQHAGINNLIDQYRQYPSGVLMLISALFIATPYCGYLFTCGCDWPWAGLAEHCNYYTKSLGQHCPWCVSYWASGLSLGIALYFGFQVANRIQHQDMQQQRSIQLTIAWASGLVVFLFCALIGAALSAWYQGYSGFSLTF